MRADNPMSRPLAPDSQLTGVSGEHLFAREFGLEPNRFHDGPGGDGGIDYWLELRTPTGVRLCSVDVKSRHHPNPRAMLVEVGKVKADIYVLASVDEHLGNALLGWATRAEVLAAPVVVLNNITNHELARSKLHLMSKLHEMADGARG